jgi:ATP-dependent Clp protease ATP-binding subunit ClpC
MQILSRRTKNNPVLLGPAGVGKTAIAEGLAQRIVSGMVPDNLQQMRVVALDVSMLIVGARFRGDFEERMQQLLQEVVRAGNLILVIDELQTLLGTGVADGSVDMANMFKPMLARGEFRCIGAATFDDYRKTIEHDPALERRFQPVLVAETSPEETLEILRGLAPRYASFHQVTITEEALQAAVQLSTRYVQQRSQPDKAIDLVDEASAHVCVDWALAPPMVQRLREVLGRTRLRKDRAIRQHDYPLALRRRQQELALSQALFEQEQVWYQTRSRLRPVVTTRNIAEVVALWTGIPLGQIMSNEAAQLLHLEKDLHRQIIAQHEAVRLLAQSVRRAYARMRDQRRPIGSFLFVGPTGVGKSALARTLAGVLFHDETALLNLDMSEFMERHQAARLLGSPPGYIGYDDGGQLTEFVRRRPYSIILFDEIEKAHPDVFNLLLQVFEDGTLTDAHGQVVDFRHTLIILTSNLGTEHVQREQMRFALPGQRESSPTDLLRDHALSAVHDFFHPEFLQRIDEIIFFHPLEFAHLQQIVTLLIDSTSQRLAQQSIHLQVTDAARALLVNLSYEPAYGARPLRRTVQRLLDDLLAESILHGTLAPHDLAVIDVVQDELVLHVQAFVGVGCRC